MDHDQENGDGGALQTGGATSAGAARWNPTKEQITMLENLYRQGVRTPSAEQIQQITTRLRAYGHIEGKNVFYWFQNHKARQRQKQKQESLAYLNRFIHRPVPVFAPPPRPNVMCNPYQGEVGYYPQFPIPTMIVPTSNGLRRKPNRPLEKVDTSRFYATGSGCGYGRGEDVIIIPQSQTNTIARKDDLFGTDGNNDVTLPLFPLHPTGVLSSSSFASTSQNVYTVSEDTNYGTMASHCEQPFFDFFSSH